VGVGGGQRIAGAQERAEDLLLGGVAEDVLDVLAGAVRVDDDLRRAWLGRDEDGGLRVDGEALDRALQALRRRLRLRRAAAAREGEQRENADTDARGANVRSRPRAERPRAVEWVEAGRAGHARDGHSRDASGAPTTPVRRGVPAAG
jgi:hypothetical protein